MKAARTLLAAALLAAAPAARGAEVRVPIPVDVAFLRHALEARVFTDPGGTARVFDDGRGCNRLVLSRPEVSMRGDRVRVTADVDARVGTRFLGFCFFPLAWRGGLEALEEPRLDAPGSRVRFVVVDSALVEPGGGSALSPARIWDWVKPHVHPRLESLTLDLSDTLAGLRAVVPLFLSAATPETARAVAESVTLADVRPTPDGVTVLIRFEAPAAERPPAPPEPALTPDELARFEASAQRFDAFLTFVVKQAGGEIADASVRRDLLIVLLEGREDLVEAAARPAMGADDPVRAVFVRTWERLAPVIRRIGSGLPGDAGLRYLGFLAAGDALRALDALGPAAGFEISADGLRRLARALAPQAPGDPLAFDREVDPSLREVFGFGPPLPPPDPADEAPPNEGAPAPGTGATPESDAAPPDGPAPETAPGTRPPAAEPPAPEAAPAGPPPAEVPPPATSVPRAGARGWLASLASIFAASDARAAGLSTPPGVSPETLRRLNRWAPTAADLDAYLPLLRDLLRGVAAERLADDPLAPEFRSLFTPLVLTTAWQETCWRQFVRRGGRLAPVRSSAGAIGLMQVNANVWRGFYDVPALERDVAYNARAGTEILMRYLVDEAIEGGEHRQRGSVDDLARATYAAYNGGPRAVARWRDPKAPRRVRAVDELFWRRFTAVKAGDELAVASCWAGSG